MKSLIHTFYDRITPHAGSVRHKGRQTSVRRLAGIMAAIALACATGNSAAQSVPQPRSLGAMTYVSGGIGSDEVEYMRSIRSAYNLRLVFASRNSGEYLAGTQVEIISDAGTALAVVTSEGPYFYAHLPEGVYRVRAVYRASGQTFQADLRQGRTVTLQVYWPAEQD